MSINLSQLQTPTEPPFSFVPFSSDRYSHCLIRYWLRDVYWTEPDKGAIRGDRDVLVISLPEELRETVIPIASYSRESVTTFLSSLKNLPIQAFHWSHVEIRPSLVKVKVP